MMLQLVGSLNMMRLANDIMLQLFKVHQTWCPESKQSAMFEVIANARVLTMESALPEGLPFY